MTAHRTGRRSLRRRLLGGMLVWVVLSLALTGLVLQGLFRHHAETQFHADLQRELDRLTAGFELPPGGQPQVSPPGADPRWRQPYSGLYWQVNTPDGEITLRSRSLWDQALRLPRDTLGDGQVHVHRLTGPDSAPLRVLERQVWTADQPDRRWQLAVAADTRPLEAAVRRFTTLMALALAVLAGGLMLAVWLQLRVGLLPLRRLQESVARVRRGDTPRLQGDFPLEVEALAEDFNTVLDQNARLVEQARTQAGNLAHALKTPLAVLSQAAATSSGELARLVEEQVASARRQVDWHLARARAAAVAGTPGARTPLRPALESLTRVMSRVHADKSLTISLHCDDTAAFAGQEPELLDMLGNLIDNACKWTGGRVDIRVEEAGPVLRVHVADDGPGLSEDRRAEVLQRGVRTDERVPGSGLGLAIVDDLARLHGGGIRLETSVWGGLEVFLELPSAVR